MNRIGTFAQSQVLSAELMRLNQQQFETQTQIATGKVASQFSDLPKQANVLLSARGTEAKIDLYKRAAEEVQTRIDLQDLHMDGLSTAADDLRQAITTAVANESGILVLEEIDKTFRSTVNLLNMQLDGKYLYAGTRTDQPPVTSDQLSDLVAAMAADDLFSNNTLRPSVQIDDTVTIEHGFLADELGRDLFAAVKRIAEYNAGPNGPFGEKLTQAQKTYLESEIGTLRTIASDINGHLARNGLNFREVEQTIERHEAGDIFVKGFISDIEDVDLAEAVSRLNNDQVAVEASTRVLADLTRLSLLDFI